MIEKVKISEIKENGRFDATPYASENASLSRYTNRLKSNKIGELSFIHKVRNRDSRVYVKDISRGLMYLSNTDMQKANYDSASYMSKKFLPNIEEQKLKKGDILISAVGTIGQITLVNELLEDAVISGNILRFTPKEKPGYIYAYLQSKFGQANLINIASGSVQDFITPPKLSDFNIPDLHESKQKEINNLIIEASNLRVEANKLLREAQNKIIDVIGFKKKGLGNKISVSKIFNSHHSRFEAAYYFSDGMEIRKHIENLNHKLLKEISKPIFRPGIFKRHYVTKGLDFLGGSDIVKAIPKSEKKLSITKTSHLNSLKIEEDWILVTCGGTIGFSVLVNKFMHGKTASQHILRVIANDIPTGYLFAFMSSKLGLNAIQSFTYGSVIPQIEPHHLELLPVPILEKDLMNSIHELIMKYKNNVSKAISNELEAIELVEKEIESWQK